jgi:hypothetical protein
MPFSAGGDVPNNLSVPQFLKLIGETLNLDSKQAMSKLGVRSLSGINLRKALEQLQLQVQQENGNGSAPAGQQTREARENLSPASRPAPNSAPTSRLDGNNAGTPFDSHNGSEARNEPRAVIGFDEEEQEPEDELLDELEELDFSRELTNQQRIRAREIIKELREIGGVTAANPNRQQVLNNVISSQISEQQLMDLTQGVWNIAIQKRLKIEQVEKLISWAKADDFVSEVEDILLLLEEEG